MASGGIHDHLGGGFHRYSTDDPAVPIANSGNAVQTLLVSNATVYLPFRMAAGLVETRRNDSSGTNGGFAT